MDRVWYDLLLSMLGSCCFVVSLVVCVEFICMRACEARRLSRISRIFDQPPRELVPRELVPRELVPRGVLESKGGEYSDCESVTSF